MVCVSSRCVADYLASSRSCFHSPRESTLWWYPLPSLDICLVNSGWKQALPSLIISLRAQEQTKHDGQLLSCLSDQHRIKILITYWQRIVLHSQTASVNHFRFCFCFFRFEDSSFSAPPSVETYLNDYNPQADDIAVLVALYGKTTSTFLVFEVFYQLVSSPICTELSLEPGKLVKLIKSSSTSLRLTEPRVIEAPPY